MKASRSLRNVSPYLPVDMANVVTRFSDARGE